MSVTLLSQRVKLPFLAFLFLTICLSLPAAFIYVVNSESRTLSRIDTDTDTVSNVFTQLGVIPNMVIVDENYLWCVNSGDNALQKIDRSTGATLANILIESGCNPWDAVSDGTYIYVTGLFTNKVYKVNMTTHAVEGYVNVGIAPEALCVYAGFLYVTNTGGYQNNYANSSVSVIDLNSFTVTDTIPVSANPQYIIEHDGLLHVSCTGNWVNAFGAVCVINPAQGEVIQTITIGGSLGGIWINGFEQGLVGDGNGQYLYRYDAADFSILNDSSNPLPNGGSAVWGNDELTALLYPNWGQNGKVRILHPNLTFWKEYNVGMAPTDMKLWTEPTSSSDEFLVPNLNVKVYPNPFKSFTSIQYKLPEPEKVRLEIYNLKGQRVKSLLNDKKQSGTHSSVWNGTDENGKEVSAGIYFCKLVASGRVTTSKLIIMK